MFTRIYGLQLAARLAEPRRFLQVVAGPRQVGKTTLVRKALEPFGEPARYVTAAEPTLRDREWIAQQWDAARQVIASFHLRKKRFSQVSVVGVDSRGCRPHALRAYDDNALEDGVDTFVGQIKVSKWAKSSCHFQGDPMCAIRPS